MDLREVIAGRTAQEQNLANPERITIARAPGFTKSIVLDALSLISAGAFGYAYYRYLTLGLPIWALLLALAFFGILSALQVFLAKDSSRRLLVALGEIILLLAFFWTDDWHILLVTGVLMAFFVGWGYWSGRSRMENSVEIPFFSVTSTALGKFTTAMLVFMILTYVPQIGNGAAFISQQNFKVIFNWASGVVNGIYPGVTLSGTFGDFAQSVAKMELADNQNFQNLSAANQNTAVSQAATQFTAAFAKTASAPVTASSTTSDAFYDLFVGMLNAWKTQASSSFAVGWAIVLFFLLRSIGVVFVWIEQFLTLVVYEILLAAGFMKVTEQTQTREVIGY